MLRKPTYKHSLEETLRKPTPKHSLEGLAFLGKPTPNTQLGGIGKPQKTHPETQLLTGIRMSLFDRDVGSQNPEKYQT